MSQECGLCHYLETSKGTLLVLFCYHSNSCLLVKDNESIYIQEEEKNRLFEEHEELLGLFAKLKELRTKEEQAESVELQEHATKVMSTLDEGIKELDDLDTFFSFLTQIGQSHRKIPGFKPDYFWKIEKPFLEAVKMTLGDRYTENVENIYKVTIKLIIETLEKGYNT
ncbi:neuroglobin-like isoform X2 [Rhodnius prolixus]|uniref:neuroglobin-like isoform X2 n=1 Tax=Rhodnius prolixus TaxID=13249 RepID=UPI003D18CA5C